MMKAMVWRFACVLCLTFAQGILAQEKSAGMAWEFFSEVGSILPDQIDSVTEILPMWGVGSGVKIGGNSFTLQVTNATAEGTKWFNIGAEARTDIKLSSLVGSVGVGLDVNSLDRPSSEGREFIVGGHVGGGVMALIGGGTYFRMTMKFAANPGVALFIGFGLLYRPSEDT